MLLLGAATADAAKIVCSPAGMITYTETTEWGDISIIFKKCMANNLYTFYSVKLNNQIVNTAEYSDNIGPFLVNGFWMGGNHNNTQTQKPTANTLFVSYSVDGEQISPRMTVTGSVLTIDVENEILYADGKKFATEYMSYVVSGNSIEVYGEHVYEHPTPMVIDRYYGMQSMFNGETEILTPGGNSPLWQKLVVANSGHEVQFTKASAPEFCTFVEHSANGYQASYMVKEELGNRDWIDSDNDVVFIGNSWSKCYHKIIGGHTVKAGDRSSWHGIYSWFDEPVTDNCRNASDDNVFEYGAYINGEPVVMHLNSDGSMLETAGIDDITADIAPTFATAGDGLITISEDAPQACCFDIAGKIVHRGSGSFSCQKGVYIVNDMKGHAIKLIVK